MKPPVLDVWIGLFDRLGFEPTSKSYERADVRLVLVSGAYINPGKVFIGRAEEKWGLMYDMGFWLSDMSDGNHGLLMRSPLNPRPLLMDAGDVIEFEPGEISISIVLRSQKAARGSMN